jgi:hypothetical protein
VHWVVGKFEMGVVVANMFCIYQPPNAHEQISGTLLSNAMAAAAVKKIYSVVQTEIRLIPGIEELLKSRSQLLFIVFCGRGVCVHKMAKPDMSL